MKPGRKLASLAGTERRDRLTRLGAAAGVRLRYLREMSGDAEVLGLPRRHAPAEAAEIAARLESDSDVAYAEPDAILHPARVPNDPRYPDQWHYAGPGSVRLPGAWDLSTGAAGLVVAVIDTGYRPHADLAGRLVPGYDFINDVQTANDGDGRDASALDPGDWVSAQESTADCPAHSSTWHGTHVAGTIGAATNNGAGVAGVNWRSTVLPARVLGKCGGYVSDIVDAMRWAAGLTVPGVPSNLNPAKVLNLSLGGPGSCAQSFQTAIDAILLQRAVVVVAAGNQAGEVGDFAPANCQGVVTVAATDRAGGRAYYSNFGAAVEISAPGGDLRAAQANGVLSTLNTGSTVPAQDSYAFYQGTSMATPHVAGIVSLMLSVAPFLSPDEVLQILQQTARPFPAGSSCNTSICGAGIVDAAAAVRAAAQRPTPPLPPSAPLGFQVASAGGTGLTLSWRPGAGGGPARSYKVYYDPIFLGEPTPGQCRANCLYATVDAGLTSLVLSDYPSFYASQPPGIFLTLWFKVSAVNESGESAFSRRIAIHSSLARNQVSSVTSGLLLDNPQAQDLQITLWNRGDPQAAARSAALAGLAALPAAELSPAQAPLEKLYDHDPALAASGTIEVPGFRSNDFLAVRIASAAGRYPYKVRGLYQCISGPGGSAPPAFAGELYTGYDSAGGLPALVGPFLASVEWDPDLGLYCVASHALDHTLPQGLYVGLRWTGPGPNPVQEDPALGHTRLSRAFLYRYGRWCGWGESAGGPAADLVAGAWIESLGPTPTPVPSPSPGPAVPPAPTCVPLAPDRCGLVLDVSGPGGAVGTLFAGPGAIASVVVEQAPIGRYTHQAVLDWACAHDSMFAVTVERIEPIPGPGSSRQGRLLFFLASALAAAGLAAWRLDRRAVRDPVR
jgi:serine protease